jgi:ribose transport system substrate-binding protein
MKNALVVLTLILAGVCLPVLNRTTSAADVQTKKEYRFVIVPKVVHPWFDKVNDGAKDAAKMLTNLTKTNVVIDYRAPQTADVVVQNQILESAIATKPDGLTLDLLDPDGNRPVLEEAKKQRIPVVVFDSQAPKDMNLPSVGNDYHAQAEQAAERLVKLLGGKGKVAIMQGVPTAPNHRIRAEAYRETFAKYPGIQVVAEGIDNDDIETAQKEASSIISAHPDLNGFVECDAAGPIGVGIAIKEANKVGKIIEVGLDDLNQLLDLIDQGVVDSSVSTKPKMQGYWAVLALWQKAHGANLPDRIDTGVVTITKDMIKGYQGF